jgi:cytidylate kinase
MIIAIDGPAGAGKSTVAREVARRLKFLYIDTGAMYRALTLKILQELGSLAEEAKIVKIARTCRIKLVNKDNGSLKIYLDKRDITDQIRSPAITRFVSDIAKIEQVRKILVSLQREIGSRQNAVLDGRDIGTVVFPEAEKKFYLDADFKERVKRRYKELKQMKQDITLQQVQADLSRRDEIDSTRDCSPLRRAQDAVYIDTTDMTIEEVAEKVLEKIQEQ